MTVEGNGISAGEKAAAGRTSPAQNARPEGSPISSGEDDLVVAEKPVRPEHHQRPHLHQPHHQQQPYPSSHQLLPPRPVMSGDHRAIPRILQPGGSGTADNSETDSADEVGASHAAPISAENLQPTNLPVRNGSLAQESLTVRDLVSGVIESQLKRVDSHSLSTPLGVTSSPIYPPGPSESPTITSILKDSQRNYALGRSSAPPPAVTNTAPTPPPRPLLMMPHHPAEAKHQTILILESAVRFQVR